MRKPKSKTQLIDTANIISLWILAALMITSFTLLYRQNLPPASFFVSAQQESSDYFIVFSCPGITGKTYGWGNRSVGSGLGAELGCFNSKGSRVAGIHSLQECRTLMCNQRPVN